MMFGILFQEYYETKHMKKGKTMLRAHRMVWVVASTLLVMAFIGNLKTSLVVNNYYGQTLTIEEIFEKDLILHSTPTLYDFLRTLSAVSNLNKRLFHQANKGKPKSISNKYVCSSKRFSLLIFFAFI